MKQKSSKFLTFISKQKLLIILFLLILISLLTITLYPIKTPTRVPVSIEQILNTKIRWPASIILIEVSNQKMEKEIHFYKTNKNTE